MFTTCTGVVVGEADTGEQSFWEALLDVFACSSEVADN